MDKFAKWADTRHYYAKEWKENKNSKTVSAAHIINF